MSLPEDFQSLQDLHEKGKLTDQEFVDAKAATIRKYQEAPIASRSPVMTRTPQFPVAPASPSRVNYLLLGLVLLAVIAVGIWYFSQSESEPSPNVVNPSSDIIVPVVTGAKTKVPTAQTDEPSAEVTQLAQDMRKQTREFNQQNWDMNNVFNDIGIGIASNGCAYMNSPEAKANVSKLTSLSASMHAAEAEDLEITRRAETLGPLVNKYYPAIVNFYNQGIARGKATHEKAEGVYNNPCFR